MLIGESMSNNVKVNVDVSDNGTTSKLTKVVEVLKGTLKGAADAASTIRVPSAVLAARQGVTASNQQRQPVAAKAASAAKQEMQDYDKVRGGIGTGAAGRDFAKQSEGLGGLVRVYATFAANLFAVTAAYSALSKAADTSNMVKGLDQLGASSGRALGSLAKQLNQVTDGAISMRDAMTATVSASAGGMTNAAILRMGVVAKQASQALGVAMPDALSRISRGITKLEPELLDEIGIMVRVDTASQNYARTLGKSASALTDFEKRQGFANAVLEQGEKKFGAIKLDTNPYDKLLASMQNLAQSGLELVNKVLGPLINMLSSSPTALATVMAGIGVVLLKQAVPAIGAWRDGLKALALEAGKTANRINSEFAIYQVEQTNKHADELEKRITKEKAAAVRSLNIAQDATKASGLSKGKVYELTQNIPKDATEATAAYKLLDAQIKSNTTRGLNLAASDSKAAKAALDRAEALKKLKDQMPELIRLEGELVAARQKADAEMQADPKYFSEAGIRERNAQKARLAASKAEVLSNVASNTQVMGIAGAWDQTKADVASKGLKGLDAGVTKLRAGLIIGTSALGSLVSSLGTIGMAIGMAVGAFALLSSWLSKNGEQAEKFNNSVTGVTDAVKTLSSTLDFIADKDPLSVFSVETIQARATALQGLSDSLTSLVKDFDRLQKSSNWFDKGIDALWDSIGKGSADVLSTNIAKAVSSGLAGAAAGPMKAEAIEKLQAILGKGIDVTDIKQVNAELRKLNDAEVSAAGAEINKILQDISRNANNAATDLVSATTRLKEISDLVQTQNLALMPTDAVGKLGATILGASADLAKGLQDPINGMLVLNKLVNDSKSLSILSPSVASDLIGAKASIEELNDSYSKLQSDLAKGEKELQELKTGGKLTQVSSDAGGNTTESLTEAGRLVTESISRINAAIITAEVKMKATTSELSMKVATDFVNVGLANLNQSVKTAMAEGGVTAAKGYLSVLKDAGVGTADAEAKLAQQEIGMQRQVLEASYRQIRAQQQNTNAIELNNIGQRLVVAALELSKASTVREIDNAQEKLSGLDTELAKAIQRAAVTNMDPKQALALKAGGDISTEVLAGMAPYMSALSGYMAAMAKLGGASEAARIQGFAAKEKEALSQQQKGNTARIGAIDTDLSAVNNAIALSAQYDEQLASKKDVLELEKLTLQLANDQLKVSTDLRIIGEARKGGKVSTEEITKAQDAAVKAMSDRSLKFEQDAKLKATESLKTRLTGLEEIRKKEEVNNTLVRTETDAITSAKLTQYDTELQFLQQIGALSAEELTRKQADVALQQQSLEYDKQKSSIEQGFRDSFMDLETKKALAPSTEAASLFQAQQDTLVASYLRQAEAQALINGYKVTNITLTAQQKALQESQTADMEKMVSATESLSTIFGELGTNIGLAGQAILKMSQDDEKYAKDRVTLEENLNRAKSQNDGSKEGTEKELAASKALATLDKKRAKDEISNIESIASKSKKLFAEKTAAYKVLNAVEKTAAAFKLAMQVRDAAMDLKNFAIKIGLLQAEVPIVAATTAAKTGIEVAGQAATMPAKIAGVYASFMSALGPFGPPAAALAIAAFIGSFAGGSKGGGTVNMTGLTSADRQEVQGTGQSWVNGQKVDTGGGVFGDSEAKSSAIVDSLEIMRANSIIGLDYDNRMLKALEKLADSVVGAAKSLYAIPGLRQGTNFGTQEGTTSSGGFGSDIPIVGGILSSIFGGGTTSSSSIQSAGIQFKGSFQNVMEDMSGSILQYKDILTQFHEDGGWFGSDSDWSTLNRETNQLRSEVSTSLSDIFKDANALFRELGTKTGVTADQINRTLASFQTNFDVDIKGLSGQAIIDELNGVIGSVLSTVSQQLFAGFEKFKNFGEDYLATVVRVVDANNKVKMSLTSIGMSVAKLPADFAAAQKEQLDAQAKLDALKVRKAEEAKKIAESEAAAKASQASEVPKIFQGLSSGYVTKALTRILGRFNLLGTSMDKVATLLPDPTLIAELAQAERDLAAARQENASATLSFESSERLVKNAGGLEAFMEQAGFFKENFLSTAEQLAPIQRSVGDELARLGLSAGTTKEELKSLVLSQNLNTEAGQDMYQSLMELAPGFQLMTSLTEQLAQETETSNAKTRDLTIELLRAEGFATEALNLERERELTELDGINKVMQIRINELEDEAKVITSEIALYTALGLTEEALILTRAREMRTVEDLLKPAKLYLYALQDQAAIKSKLTTAYNKENSALKTTLNTLSTSIKTLNDYRTTLLAGDKSILTPAEKYQQSKFQAEQIAAIATGIATTDAEILAKQEAISKLPSVTGTFLEASKGLYASSEQYTQDFNSVLALLDATGVSLVKQQTDAEKQLETLNNSYSALGFIEENTATTAELIAQYLSAVSSTESARFTSQASGSTASSIIPAFASGGLAQGIALVGEQGPELVDFKTPARVYSNRASNDLLNNTDLINEIKNLRSELTQLRKEQQEQTGYLIKSNYDANARAADKVVNATEDASSQMEWKARSAVKIA